MANHYSDPTANTAIGNVDRELKSRIREAESFARRYHRGIVSPEEIAIVRRRFRGIYAPLLAKALEAY